MNNDYTNFSFNVSYCRPKNCFGSNELTNDLLISIASANELSFWNNACESLFKQSRKFATLCFGLATSENYWMSVHCVILNWAKN